MNTPDEKKYEVTEEMDQSLQLEVEAAKKEGKEVKRINAKKENVFTSEELKTCIINLERSIEYSTGFERTGKIIALNSYRQMWNARLFS